MNVRALRLVSMAVLLGIMALAAACTDGDTSTSAVPSSDTTISTAGIDPAAFEREREEAVSLYNEGDLEAAVPALEAYLEKRPDDAEAAALLAQAYWLTGDAEASISRYEAVLAAGGDDGGVLYQLALVQRAQGDYDAATESLEAALDSRPDATEFRIELARTLRIASDWDRAAAEWEAVIAALPADDPALPGCYYELGLSHLGAGDKVAARAAFEKGAALNPDDPTFGKQLQALGDGES